MRLRSTAGCVLVLTALMVLAVGGLTACGDPDDSSTGTVATEGTSTSVAVVATTSTTIPPTTSVTVSPVDQTIYPTTTTAPPATTGPTLPDLSGSIPKPPAEVSTVDMSSVAFLVEEYTSVGPGGLYAYLFATEKMAQVPVGDGVYVNGMDIDGDLVVWAERAYSNEPDPRSSVYAYRLPDGPKVKLVGDSRRPFAPHIDGGRVFWAEATHVSGNIDEMEEELYTQVIWMVEVDDNGQPTGSPVRVTDRPNSSHEAGGNELWSYDVEGSHLAYQRMWGDEPGVHLVDLDSGKDTYLGEGDIPTVSSSLVAWRGWPGEPGSQVWAYNLATGRVAVLAEDGHMPFAGPGYVIYAQQKTDGSGNDLYLLDEQTGSTTLLGMTTAGLGWPFISIAGNSDRAAWVTKISTTPGEAAGEHYELRLVALPNPLGSGDPGRNIWEGAQDPPMVAE